MKKVIAHKLFPEGKTANIEQLSARRAWMDETPDKHAYMCFPLNLTNRLGWGLSFPTDIRFVWDGITDGSGQHVKILEGEEFAHPDRGNATISFLTGIRFMTDETTSMMTMPVPNEFVRGAQCYTTLMSTSFYFHMLPVAWRITEPNLEICIPAGTPVAAVLPISLTGLQNDYEMEIIEEPATSEYWSEVQKYGDVTILKNMGDDWSKMYREALDYRGEKVGEHETKSIKLKTVTCPFTGQTYEVEDTDGEETPIGHA